MNWKLIFQLSFFGLIMACATVALIPQIIEPAFWIVVFVFSAWVIARSAPGKYFLHGFVLSLANCVWITLIHFYFYDTYAAHHPQVVAMYPGTHPRLMLMAFAPAFGIGSGIVQGLFAFIASKIVKKNPQ